MEQCGFTNLQNIQTKFPNELKKQIENKNLWLIPKGAIAKSSSDAQCLHCRTLKRSKTRTKRELCNSNKDSGLSCSLPLPVDTGIPAIINGNFILDYETRRNLWSSETQSRERLWNNLTIVNCVLPCYLEFLSVVKKEIGGQFTQNKIRTKTKELNDYYDNFPSHTESEGPYWKLFTESFYKFTYENDLPLVAVLHKNKLDFCNIQSKFIEYTLESELDLASATSNKTNILDLLKKCSIEIDQIRPEISKSFKHYGCELTTSSPSVIRNRLIEVAPTVIPNSTPIPINQTVFKNVNNVMTLLKFCTSDATKDHQVSLTGLPLCCLADDTVNVFSEDQRPYFTKFNSFFAEKKGRFINKDIYYAYQHYVKKTISSGCFSDFTLEDFSELLGDCDFSRKIKQQEQPLAFDEVEEITEEWLQQFWKFVHSTKEEGKN